MYIKFIKYLYSNEEMKYYFLILGSLILFIILSLSFNGVSISAPTPVYAQSTQDLVATITSACQFADGDDPSEFSNCLPFNNGSTISFENVQFTANSNLPVKQFICTLQRDGFTVPLGNTDNICTISSIQAKAVYLELEGGNYQFYVTAVRDVRGPLGNVIDDESLTSAVFHFRMLSTGTGGAGGLERDIRLAPGGEIAIAENANDQGKILDKINPIWASCDPDGFGQKIIEKDGKPETGDDPLITKGARLSAMKYLLGGDLSFSDLVQGLKKQGVNDFVVEIYTNFISRSIAAEVYPAAKEIPKLRSTSDLYKSDPFIIADSTVPRDKSDVPNRIPFKVQSVDTKCVYEAPDIATSQEIGGPFTRITPSTFLASNPPFQTCGTDSESATYKITFSIRDMSKKGIDSSKVQFQIIQQISGLDPQYAGVLAFEPFHDDEKRIELMLNGHHIVTECGSAILKD